MKRVLLTMLICVSAFHDVTADEPFRFAVMNDGRGAVSAAECRRTGVSPVFDTAVQSILQCHAEKPIRLLVFPGDLISGYIKRDANSVDECNRIQLGEWREKAKPLLNAGIGVRVTLGNHETAVAHDLNVKCGEHLRPYTASLANFAAAQEILADMIGGNQGPAGDMGFSYVFDMGPCRFIMLNSYTMTHAGAFSEDTIRFLQEEAAKARSEGRITFVASHAPAFPGGGHMYDSLPLYDPTFNCAGYDPLYGIDRRRERDRFWNILKTNGVAAYFTGHEHNTQVQEVEGVWHVIAGGLTEKLYPLNGAPEDKKTNTILYDGRLQNPRASLRWPWDEKPASYWGWCLVTVDGGRVTMEVRGTDTFPKNPADFKLLKTFTLAPRPGS